MYIIAVLSQCILQMYNYALIYEVHLLTAYTITVAWIINYV